MFSPKDPIEIFTLSFDFSKINSAVTSASVACAIVSGTDSGAAAMVSGAAQISGSLVMQQIINGVDGCSYDIRCTANTPDGNKYVLADVLTVITK